MVESNQTIRWGLICLVIAAICVIASSIATEGIATDGIAEAAANEIRGNTFHNYNADGDDAGQTEYGLGGIQLQAHDVSNSVIGSPVATDFDGNYTIADLASGQQVWLEGTISEPLGYIQPSAKGSGSGTTVVFATEGDANVNVGFNIPAGYCQYNPFDSAFSTVDYMAGWLERCQPR